MHDENKKMQLWREEIVKKNMRNQMITGGMIGLAGLILSGMVALITFGFCTSLPGDSLFIVIGAILMLIALWGAVLFMLVGGSILLLQGLYILQGKYTIEVDKVELLELKSEYELRRSPLGRGYHRVLVTNQYVHFAKYGKFKSKRVLRQDQECYLFVVLTKKPQILEFWECEEYEIKGA